MEDEYETRWRPDFEQSPDPVNELPPIGVSPPHQAPPRWPRHLPTPGRHHQTRRHHRSRRRNLHHQIRDSRRVRMDRPVRHRHLPPLRRPELRPHRPRLHHLHTRTRRPRPRTPPTTPAAAKRRPEVIPDPSRLEAALNRKATAVHQEAQRLSPRQLGPLRSDGIAQFGITAEEAMLRLATALGGPTVNHPRVLFIGGPLDGRIHPTPIPDTGRIDIHQNGTCFQYQTETLNIAGETTIVAVLDTPDTLPTQVQAALDLIAQHTQPFEDRPNGRPIEDDTSTNQ